METLRCPVGTERRPRQGLEVRPVGTLPEPLRLGPDRKPAGVEAEVDAEPEPEPLGNLRQLRIQPEPAPGHGLDVAVVEELAIRLAAAAELPEDRLERQQWFVDLLISTARHVGPTLGNRRAERGEPFGVTRSLVLDRAAGSEERDRSAGLERFGKGPGRHVGVNQA